MSNCQKKYCECFQLGVRCTKLCKCENCKNTGNPSQDGIDNPPEQHRTSFAVHGKGAAAHTSASKTNRHATSADYGSYYYCQDNYYPYYYHPAAAAAAYSYGSYPYYDYYGGYAQEGEQHHQMDEEGGEGAAHEVVYDPTIDGVYPDIGKEFKHRLLPDGSTMEDYYAMQPVLASAAAAAAAAQPSSAGASQALAVPAVKKDLKRRQDKPRSRKKPTVAQTSTAAAEDDFPLQSDSNEELADVSGLTRKSSNENKDVAEGQSKEDFGTGNSNLPAKVDTSGRSSRRLKQKETKQQQQEGITGETTEKEVVRKIVVRKRPPVRSIKARTEKEEDLQPIVLTSPTVLPSEEPQQQGEANTTTTEVTATTATVDNPSQTKKNPPRPRPKRNVAVATAGLKTDSHPPPIQPSSPVPSKKLKTN